MYLRGLVTLSGKKSIRNISEAILDDPSATQALQQFVNQSPWDWGPVRTRLVTASSQIIRPGAWIVEHAVISKRGQHSVGVEPRFVSHEGRTINSQLGVGILAASPSDSLPLNWRLYLSRRWLEDGRRRERTRIPEDVQVRSATELALEMVDELIYYWKASPVPPIVAGAHPRDASTLAQGLLERSLEFVIQVEGDFGPLSDYRRVAQHQSRAASLRSGFAAGAAAAANPRRDWAGSAVPRLAEPQPGFTRNGEHRSRPALTAPELDLAKPADAARVRLVREHSTGRAWLVNLSSSSLRGITDFNTLRARSRTTVGQLEHLGLRDFEGRSFPGWHHHLTLVSAAALFSRLRTG